MPETKAVTYRLGARERERIREMAEAARRPQVEIVGAAVDHFYDTEFKESRALAEKQADEGLALVRKFEERLGPKFWREDGATEIAFGLTEHGRVVVVAGDHRYLEHEDGRLLKAQVKGGHLLVSPIEEDGSIGDRMAMPIGDPVLN